jgi:CHAT domain-containing protein
MPAGAALIEFVRFDQFDFRAIPGRGEPKWKPARYVAFVLHAERPDDVRMVDLGNADAIDRLIAAFREAIISGGRRQRDVEGEVDEPVEAPTESVGLELLARVFAPLRQELRGCNQLLLAPDGDLARLPFEVLPSGKGESRLIDEYRIGYLATGRDVLRIGAAHTGEPTAPLVVADPDFNLATGGPAAPDESSALRGRLSRDLDRGRYHFSRLPGTLAEGECVAGMLGVRPWLNAGALEARLKTCRSPRILHLATHGFFLENQKHDPNREAGGFGLFGTEGPTGRLTGPLPENPLLRSGLGLAGVNTWLAGGSPPAEAEDGILTAEDVTGLDLLDTELVVLSACETGLGEVRVGEGVFGLRRAFVLAGARTLVMSLWKVPDEQTRELMEEFYRRLLAGAPRADALREAQLAIRAKHPHPYFWGAFICQGDLGPLSKT